MTQCVLLSAGRGERLRPLTDVTPKPLVEVGGETLIGRHLAMLKASGAQRVIVNLGWLGEHIAEYVGDGRRWGVNVIYSAEGFPTLDTGGAIAKAIALLNDAPFWVINADIWTDFMLPSIESVLPQGVDGAIGLVDNPRYRASGDFSLQDGLAKNDTDAALTFSGIACYHPRFFRHQEIERFSVVPLLREAAEQNKLGGFKIVEAWFDSGTHERLAELRAYANS
ncbi:MAG: nucleotidyltransferase family protein [Pseudomonadota bacterium]